MKGYYGIWASGEFVFTLTFIESVTVIQVDIQWYYGMWASDELVFLPWYSMPCIEHYIYFKDKLINAKWS